MSDLIIPLRGPEDAGNHPFRGNTDRIRSVSKEHGLPHKERNEYGDR